MITGDQTAAFDFLSSPSTHRVAVANDTHSAVVPYGFARYGFNSELERWPLWPVNPNRHRDRLLIVIPGAP